MADERELVEAARRGDAQAWEALVLAHQQPVFRLAYLLLGDADDAQDIAQEAFVRAYYSLDRFDPTRPLRPWLMRIATNLCHNWRRSLGRSLAGLGRLLRSEPPDRSAVQQAEENLEAETLRQAVGRLRAEDQRILYLRFFLECTEAETAEVLGIALGTVKSRAHRALARLRALLKEEYPSLSQESLDVP